MTIFFVLSGFLITGLLVEERVATERVDLRGFYARRVRRLAPALLAFVAAVVLCSTALGDWWFEWRDLPPVLLYFSNWVEAGDPSGTALGALRITWSLAIEEQFYTLWPLAVLLLGRRRRVVIVALLLAATSLGWRLALLDASSIRVYYGSYTTAFALLVGAAAVGFRLGGGPGKSRPWALVATGLVVAWCASWPTEALMKLGVPIMGLASVAAVWFCTGAGPVRVMETRALRWLGLRSYGLYLWHGPLLWAMRDHFALPWHVVATVGVPASLLLAEASWRFVESPWRRTKSAPAAQHEKATVAGVGIVP